MHHDNTAYGIKLARIKMDSAIYQWYPAKRAQPAMLKHGR